MLERCQMAIAKKLKSLRTCAGLNQVEVSDRVGISYRYYQDIEGSRVNMTLSTMVKLARFFGLRLAQLVSEC